MGHRRPIQVAVKTRLQYLREWPLSRVLQTCLSEKSCVSGAETMSFEVFVLWCAIQPWSGVWSCEYSFVSPFSSRPLRGMWLSIRAHHISSVCVCVCSHVDGCMVVTSPVTFAFEFIWSLWSLVWLEHLTVTSAPVQSHWLWLLASLQDRGVLLFLHPLAGSLFRMPLPWRPCTVLPP